MEKGIHNTNSRVRSIVEVALMAALTYLATWLLNIPYANNGVVHLGDTIIFISAALLGKKKAAIAAALGMTMFDLTSPYAIWAPFTFVVKGVMGYIAGAIAYRSGFRGNSLLNNIFAFTAAGIWMIAGYYVSAAALASTLLGGNEASFATALIISLPKIPGDIIQVVVGMVIAVPTIEALKKTRLMSNNR